MLKISGAFLCIVGCLGFGVLKISGWKRDLQHLQQFILLFQRIKSRIFYQKETLEESCCYLGEKAEGEYGNVLKLIGERARYERQKEFSAIWKDEMKLWCDKNLQHNSVKEILMAFPEYVMEADEELQMNLFSFYIEEINREKVQLEHQIQEKQKPIMAVSLAGGVVISILLL